MYSNWGDTQEGTDKKGGNGTCRAASRLVGGGWGLKWFSFLTERPWRIQATTDYVWNCNLLNWWIPSDTFDKINSRYVSVIQWHVCVYVELMYFRGRHRSSRGRWGNSREPSFNSDFITSHSPWETLAAMCVCVYVCTCVCVRAFVSACGCFLPVCVCLPVLHVSAISSRYHMPSIFSPAGPILWHSLSSSVYCVIVHTL